MASAWSVPAPAPGRPLRILVVDRCPDNRRTLAALLREWGHEPREAADGPAALRDAAAAPPDVALLGLSLPRMDGCELARRLGRLPSLAGVWLVAVTAHDSPEAVQRAAQAGFHFRLAKPAEAATLRLLLRACAGTPGPGPEALRFHERLSRAASPPRAGVV
jgi:CheY-like chemotaxis protein